PLPVSSQPSREIHSPSKSKISLSAPLPLKPSSQKIKPFQNPPKLSTTPPPQPVSNKLASEIKEVQSSPNTGRFLSFLCFIGIAISVAFLLWKLGLL
ncbi:MAG: hypothetical protein AABZ60_12350, partial [Planctomycetota bacterium]